MTRHYGTLHDITERQRAEDEVRQMQERLTHFGRISTMGEMAAGIAHEINQPLTAIATYAQACQRLLPESENNDDFREALQQILIHLLQNAGAASPLEGTVHLRVQTRAEDGKEFILIQVSDSGGGIPAEDLPRVFTRLYRADNVLIQGVGDTGVGLSIAKTLTEAQKGRIWVESQMGVGSTFSVLLPLARKSMEN